MAYALVVNQVQPNRSAQRGDIASIRSDGALLGAQERPPRFIVIPITGDGIEQRLFESDSRLPLDMGYDFATTSFRARGITNAPLDEDMLLDPLEADDFISNEDAATEANPNWQQGVLSAEEYLRPPHRLRRKMWIRMFMRYRNRPLARKMIACAARGNWGMFVHKLRRLPRAIKDHVRQSNVFTAADKQWFRRHGVI